MNIYYIRKKMETIYPEKGIESLIRLKLYKDEESIMKDAFRALLELKPSLKIEYAIDLYKKKELSLWSAANIAGITLEEFKEILASRSIRIEISPPKKESDRRLKRIFNA